MKTDEEKFQTVIEKNTFYFSNREFEESYEGHVTALKETLLVVKNQVETQGLQKTIFENLLKEKENGLSALLTLTGLSNEFLKRLTTIIRITDDSELNNLVQKDGWCDSEQTSNIDEWSDAYLSSMIKNNDAFRKGVVNLFFEGSTIPFLARTLPLFEFKKLSISKLKFEIPELVDTLIRYKEKGSYAGQKQNNPETVVAAILHKLNLTYETGDLPKFAKSETASKRTMDFIIPDKAHPAIIAESSFLKTTSSGQGDKSKTEIAIRDLIKKHYPEARFIGFVDGIGWYVRKNDLLRMVSAYEDVFTFHKDELRRFEDFLKRTFKI